MRCNFWCGILRTMLILITGVMSAIGKHFGQYRCLVNTTNTGTPPLLSKARLGANFFFKKRRSDRGCTLDKGGPWGVFRVPRVFKKKKKEEATGCVSMPVSNGTIDKVPPSVESPMEQLVFTARPYISGMPIIEAETSVGAGLVLWQLKVFFHEI